MPRIALATCAELNGLDPDDALVVAPLAARGVEAVAVVWDDPAAEWDAFDLTVVRNTWDYAARHDAFLAWARSVPRLANSAETIAWNIDKRYLGELEAAGLPIVPTLFIDRPGAVFVLPDGTEEIVVKPSISAGSQDTVRHRVGDHDGWRTHIERLVAAGRTAMVQPYLSAVDTAGETALLFFAGIFSHAIRKGPMLELGVVKEPALFFAEDIDPREPSADERDIAERAVAHVRERFGTPLYARVDLLPDADGTPTIIELELTEPSVFIGSTPGAPERFADAIAAVL